MWKIARYLMALVSIAGAIWVIFEGVSYHPKPIWPLYTMPLLLVLNAFLLVVPRSREGQIVRLFRLWLDVKEADLRGRLTHTKSSGRSE